jgi:hypothetical protein
VLKNFLEHIGIEPGRLQFSWISSSESTKFVDVANMATDKVRALGPAKHLIRRQLPLTSKMTFDLTSKKMSPEGSTSP